MQVWAPDFGFGPALPNSTVANLAAAFHGNAWGLSIANRGFKMKAILSLVVSPFWPRLWFFRLADALLALRLPRARNLERSRSKIRPGEDS